MDGCKGARRERKAIGRWAMATLLPRLVCGRMDVVGDGGVREAKWNDICDPR